MTFIGAILNHLSRRWSSGMQAIASLTGCIG
jgi:hypothetical protein